MPYPKRCSGLLQSVLRFKKSNSCNLYQSHVVELLDICSHKSPGKKSAISWFHLVVIFYKYFFFIL